LTQILKRVSAGDVQATEELFQVVYTELKRLARIAMSQERSDHTLQPTALVHEAFIHLMGGVPIDWESSFHFFSVAARTMRRILVDHARHVKAKKRSGGQRVELNEDLILGPQKADSYLGLEAALEKFEALYPRHAQVVDLKYFGGLGFEEIAKCLGFSSRTLKRDWDFARAWLHSEMSKADRGGIVPE
jgi:RNA polymerase sigma factor (TIGR02999 family)